MRSKTNIVAITAIALMLSPLAAATWMVAGTYEPDTPYDTSSWMWQQPPAPGELKVYFNVITQGSEFLVSGAVYNPNVGALHTSNEPATGEFHEAVLGLWVDCNGDGYIGMAETALREYRSELLLDNTRCPPTSGSTQRWDISKGHNYNGLVTELIPISRDATVRDTRVLDDENAKVWGDFERPDEAQHTRRCALRPLPRGTMQDSGGVLNYIDCRTPLLDNINGGLAVIGDPAGLSFSDTDDARSGTLGQLSTFGSEDSSHAAVHVQDCSADPIIRLGDLLNQTALGQPTSDQNNGGALHNTMVRPLPANPVGPDPTGTTVPGQVNATNEELVVGATDASSDCDTSNDRGADFYGRVESDNPQINPRDKRGANWNFFFATSNRGGAPASLIHPGSAGANENDLGVGWGGSRWVADSLWGSKPGIALVKADLGTAQVGPADAYWLSFYAFVGSNITSKGIQLPGGSTGSKYGAFHCGSLTSGVSATGWNCNTNTWYLNPDGSAQQGFAELDRDELAMLGQLYVLRDVDCYDGGNDLGVPTAPAGFGTDPCP